MRDLEIIDSPVDLAQAARRGTLASLERLIAAQPRRIDEADLLGMTPLAWAVVYRREQHARALLRAGASPAGSECGAIENPHSPIQIARALRWHAMAETLARSIDAERLARLREPARPRPKRPDQTALRAAMERYKARLQPGRTRHQVIVTVDAAGVARKCRLDPSTGVPELDLEYCEILLAGHDWASARGVFGEPIAGEARLSLVQDVPDER